MSQPPDTTWQTYKRLLQYTRRHWWVLSGSVLGYLIYSGMQPLIAEMMRVITETIENPTPHMVLVICVAPFVINLVQGIGQFLGAYCITWVGQRIVYELRNETFTHVLRLPTREYQQSSSGHLMSKIIYDAQQVTAAGTDAVTVILREGLTVVGLLGYLLYSNWKLTMILFTVGPIIALMVNYMSKRFRVISRRIQGSMGSITQFLGEAIEGNQPVKIFSGQQLEEERFEKASRRFQKQHVKMEVSKVTSTVTVQLVVAIGVGVITYLYIQIMGEAITVGEFLAFIAAVGLIQKPIKQLTDVNVKVQRGVTGAASLFELMDRPPEPDHGTVPLTRARGELEFRDVSFGYVPDAPVVKQLSFRVSPGETVALVGRSGAGKSTIAALVPRFYEPDQGSILLDGRVITDYPMLDLRRQIAMVTQKVVLFNDSIRNNIAYGELRDCTDDEIIRAAKDAYAWDFISKLERGLDTEVGQDGVQLSGGQRQRLAIARALLKDAPILILDEATSALDNESEHFIQQALERVMKGRTTIVIAHRLSTIEKADRILVLDQGRLMESGSHAELIAQNGLYSQLHQMNFADS
ncbi:lipid A export ATP-binding/permease MsbA [Isoalcanivorax pacificus W11-5]|uniref:Lipid A export ATP-binding/permease MsbA n=1 Tax=Isoalcanivorax pacificus W11-5 TaxID=391936 RepID=A0A0B4XPP7_9GAMM|nr:lipid A export permease/ATP-binding protein MsbA [Isoalcanivorax pacificus]AJD48408.1 lipid A export ATP-binding/permease MsbA [Isoalcanivorax pacificus W11-5]